MTPGQPSDPTRRFSNRVSYYVKYRPHYPAAVLAFLQAGLGLTPAAEIADVGSGTGILTELFLKNGNLVYGVEPNADMRAAAETLLSGYPKFCSIAGSAEATTLPEASVDWITAGQAFHWFDPRLARREFLRILRPGGWVVLVWNSRRADTTPFLRAYEKLLQAYAPEYDQVKASNVDARQLEAFFASYRRQTFPNEQRFDYASLEGRLLSSSYAPLPGHPQHEPMLAELRRIFTEHQASGLVHFEYETELYYGQLG